MDYAGYGVGLTKRPRRRVVRRFGGSPRRQKLRREHNNRVQTGERRRFGPRRGWCFRPESSDPRQDSDRSVLDPSPGQVLPRQRAAPPPDSGVRGARACSGVALRPPRVSASRCRVPPDRLVRLLLVCRFHSGRGVRFSGATWR
ncbi:unnamed protein product [Tenebrio molitor]|nr:unnamed protein product [Tenebrio molitor]